MTPFSYLTMAETIERLKKREISPVELVSGHLQRIGSLQPQLNAFVHVDGESALARAREIESAVQRGQSLGVLAGIPLSMKSNIDVAGWPCPAGSLLRKDYVPSTNAVLVDRLEAQGAIILGNTNVPEFLMSYETDSRIQGKTPNPWNLTYSAGGSSGGEAAAITSGCSMGGVGSDGGGSIRAPAHSCGICGLKPTPGRVTTTGHFPPGAGAFGWIGVVGPMARTAADLRILFEVVAGPDPGDALSSPVPIRKISPERVRGLRVGVLDNTAALGLPTSETTETVRKAAGLLAELGCNVETIQLQKLDRAIELWWFFFGPVIGRLISKNARGKEDLLSPGLQAYLRVALQGPEFTLETFMNACTERDLLRENVMRQIGENTILLSPVSTEPAFPNGAGNFTAGAAHNFRDTMRYCQWLNLVGFPGLSLPMGQSKEKLPINVQLIGQPYNEELLLAVAEALELARGPWQAPPI
jgi:Asp-tRNA(Asn)/Glu-tRNA(Gln) amidotransferase A subunit family amidase